MPTAHCLTVEVQSLLHPTDPASPTVRGGVGYMITFTLPANMQGDPEAHPSFAAFAASVRGVALAAGDLPFHQDAYTRKLALATLMHELADLNRQFPLRIGGIDGTPAVQIHSTDPLARQIELDFTDEDGAFAITERNPRFGACADVREQGRVGLIAAGRRAFPFDKPLRDTPSRTKKPPGGTPPRP